MRAVIEKWRAWRAATALHSRIAGILQHDSTDPLHPDLPNPRHRFARELFDLLRQLRRLTFQQPQLFLQALDVPPHRLVEKRRGLRRQPVQFVIGTLLERVARLQHADDFQLDANPQAAQLRDLALLPEVERRPALPQDEAVRVVRDAAQRGQIAVLLRVGAVSL